MATSRFSNPNSKAKFKKHHVHEVSTSLTESKQIANDYAENFRYIYRAKAYVVGSCNLRPFDPVYIDGVPNGLSGYWTVLSIKHKFGGIDAPYMMELELGSDKLGDVNPNAKYTSEQRSINDEISGKSLTSSGSTLTSFTLNPNKNHIPVPTLKASPKVVSPVNQIIDPTLSPYLHDSTIPNYNTASRTVSWTAKKGNKLI